MGVGLEYGTETSGSIIVAKISTDFAKYLPSSSNVSVAQVTEVL